VSGMEGMRRLMDVEDRKRREQREAVLVSLALLTFGTATFVFTMEALAALHPAWETPTSFLHFLGAASFGLFLYLFPDGRFVPRWTRWVALVWIGWQLPRYFFPGWYLNPSPYTWHALTNTTVWLGALGTAIYSQGYRYRRTASSAQRQQLKWVVFGISAALAGFLGISLLLGVFAPEPTSPGGYSRTWSAACSSVTSPSSSSRFPSDWPCCATTSST
jgi:hypothetical protein